MSGEITTTEVTLAVSTPSYSLSQALITLASYADPASVSRNLSIEILNDNGQVLSQCEPMRLAGASRTVVAAPSPPPPAPPEPPSLPFPPSPPPLIELGMGLIASSLVNKSSPSLAVLGQAINLPSVKATVASVAVVTVAISAGVRVATSILAGTAASTAGSAAGAAGGAAGALPALMGCQRFALYGRLSGVPEDDELAADPPGDWTMGQLGLGRSLFGTGQGRMNSSAAGNQSDELSGVVRRRQLQISNESAEGDEARSPLAGVTPVAVGLSVTLADTVCSAMVVLAVVTALHLLLLIGWTRIVNRNYYAVPLPKQAKPLAPASRSPTAASAVASATAVAASASLAAIASTQLATRRLFSSLRRVHPAPSSAYLPAPASASLGHPSSSSRNSESPSAAQPDEEASSEFAPTDAPSAAREAKDKEEKEEKKLDPSAAPSASDDAEDDAGSAPVSAPATGQASALASALASAPASATASAPTPPPSPPNELAESPANGSASEPAVVEGAALANPPASEDAAITVKEVESAANGDGDGLADGEVVELELGEGVRTPPSQSAQLSGLHTSRVAWAERMPPDSTPSLPAEATQPDLSGLSVAARLKAVAASKKPPPTFRRLPTSLAWPVPEAITLLCFTPGIVSASSAVLGALVGGLAIGTSAVVLALMSLCLIAIFLGYEGVRLSRFSRRHRARCWVPAHEPTRTADVSDPLLRLLARWRMLGPHSRELGAFLPPSVDGEEPLRTERALEHAFHSLRPWQYSCPRRKVRVAAAATSAEGETATPPDAPLHSRHGSRAGDEFDSLQHWLGISSGGAAVSMRFALVLTLVQCLVAALGGLVYALPWAQTSGGGLLAPCVLIVLQMFGALWCSFLVAGANDRLTGATLCLCFCFECLALCLVLLSSLLASESASAAEAGDVHGFGLALRVATAAPPLLQLSIYVPLLNSLYDAVARGWAILNERQRQRAALAVRVQRPRGLSRPGLRLDSRGQLWQTVSEAVLDQHTEEAMTSTAVALVARAVADDAAAKEAAERAANELVARAEAEEAVKTAIALREAKETAAAAAALEAERMEKEVLEMSMRLADLELASKQAIATHRRLKSEQATAEAVAKSAAADVALREIKARRREEAAKLAAAAAEEKASIAAASAALAAGNNRGGGTPEEEEESSEGPQPEGDEKPALETRTPLGQEATPPERVTAAPQVQVQD